MQYNTALGVPIRFVQNNAAKLIIKKKKYDNVTPLLQRLRVLPINYSIMYKIILLTFKHVNDIAPSHLSELCVLYELAPSLQSSNKCLLTESASHKQNWPRFLHSRTEALEPAA